MTLKEIREHKQMTQKELARLIGVSAVAVHKIEKRGSARLSVMERYAAALEVEFDALRQAATETRKRFQDMLILS